jgi:alkanesulfonate monooxygenase SsuD/methylene tetrahydromethanopterin reductase-like flavin-dependent oxidoreductase (luciferase family)
MQFDIFFSIAQTPVSGYCPSEKEMFENFFDQVKLADTLGYGCAWIAESHLSTEVQKNNLNPVVPHFKGEIGLNVDVLQLAHRVFACTKHIEVGSAIMNILCNGGPIAAAERIAAFLALHGLTETESRRLQIGFAAGRFEFMNRAYGIVPRDSVEEAAWPVVKGLIFREAAHIFLHLLQGKSLSSQDIAPSILNKGMFRSEEDWQRVKEAYVISGGDDRAVEITLNPRFVFEELKIIPKDWRRDLLDLVVGSHDPSLQAELNQIMPVKVFNLSITSPELIEDTHHRMQKDFHESAGPWQRSYMPRTVMVFLNDEIGLSEEEKEVAARNEAYEALGEYWKALEGTLDPSKVEGATENALLGSPSQIASQILKRYDAGDRLMLWFDFYNHDNERVMRNMRAFAEKVIPLVNNGSR